MSHKKLKEQLIKLGSTNPELRKDLRPILDKISSNPALREVKMFRKNLADLKRALAPFPNTGELDGMVREMERDLQGFEKQLILTVQTPAFDSKGFRHLAALKDTVMNLMDVFDTWVELFTEDELPYKVEKNIESLIGNLRQSAILGGVWKDREDDLFRWYDVKKW